MKYIENFVFPRGIVTALALALLPLGGQAATLSASLTGPTDLSAGDAAHFLLSWDDSRPSSWTTVSSSAQIKVNGTVVQSFALAPAGGTLPFALDLSEAGDYAIAATGTISYFENLWVVVDYSVRGYRCGSVFNRRTCYDYIPIYGWRTVSRGSLSLDESLTVTVSAPDPVLMPVPLPAAAPLLGAGIALMGLMGWRRRRIAA